MDATGNMYWRIRGDIAGHRPADALWTPDFPREPRKVKRDGKSEFSPRGISGHGTGLRRIAVIARSFHELKIQEKKTICLSRNVGDEGEGILEACAPWWTYKKHLKLKSSRSTDRLRNTSRPRP